VKLILDTAILFGQWEVVIICTYLPSCMTIMSIFWAITRRCSESHSSQTLLCYHRHPAESWRVFTETQSSCINKDITSKLPMHHRSPTLHTDTSRPSL